MRRTALTLFGTAAAVAAVALAAAGSRGHGDATANGGGVPVEVGAYGCIVGGGHRTVAPGSTIVIRNGWLTSRPGSVYAFLDAQTSLVSVQDGPMADVSRTYGAVEPDAEFGWATRLRYPTGATLATSGDSMRFTFTLLLDRPLQDLADLDGDGNPDPVGVGPGLAFGGTCTVTAGE
jgi:hypothetical protein